MLIIPSLVTLLAAAGSATSQPASLPALTLEQQVGQLLLINVVGRDAPSDSSARVLQDVPVGGIILFAYNLRGGPGKVARLTSSLQEIARTSGARIPYLISVDQEGGRVQRLKRGFTALPPPRRMGLLPDAALESLASAVGRQLLAVGINMNLAPVVEASAGEDNVIGNRSFAPTPAEAAPKATAFIVGTQKAGVVATAKHFPGNAGSDVDPHLAMPRIPLTEKQIHDQLLPPFASAIAAGVDAIMLSHVEIPALDKERPVALARPVVTGLLREQLGFEGIVCSDDLLMKAVLQKFTPAEAAILAIQAGTDFLMISNPAEAPGIHAALVQAVREGRLDSKLVEAAAGRVVSAKQRRGLWESADALRAGKSLQSMNKARKDAERALSHLPPEPTTE